MFIPLLVLTALKPVPWRIIQFLTADHLLQSIVKSFKQNNFCLIKI